MANIWHRVDVSEWLVRSVEQAGSSRNLWLEEPGSDQIWLQKDTVIPRSGNEQGEDWAEIVSTQVAKSLQVPTAEVRLCLRNGRRGSLSRSVVPERHALWEGSVMLEAADVDGYFRHQEGSPGTDPSRPDVKRPGHNLANIQQALLGVEPPKDFRGPSAMTGFDVFAGYMILDAVIANRDRHEQNWAVIMPGLTDAPVRLSPSYDHAGGLGYNLLDRTREGCLGDSNQFNAWVRRGTAHRFEHDSKPVPLVDQAVAALGMCTTGGADWWSERISTCSLEPIVQAMKAREIPEMSEAASKFVNDLILKNLERLRDALK